MDSNLGIYNNHHMYNENINYDINKHIEQGVQFKKYEKNYQGDNEHGLLQNSSSSEWGSIVDATSSNNAINQRQFVEGMTPPPLSADAANFNQLVSAYSTLYNTYSTTMLRRPPTDAERIAMETALTQQKMTIVAAANQLQIDISALASGDSIIPPPTQLNDAMQQLKNQNKLLDSTDKYHTDTVLGKLETTELNMNSMYYHYFVYFVLSITLIAFTFNILVNPNANVMNAIYVVGALLAVYFISRKSNIL